MHATWANIVIFGNFTAGGVTKIRSGKLYHPPYTFTFKYELIITVQAYFNSGQ